jgi:hypothetical protein
MRLTTGSLPRMFDGMDNDERVAMYVRLAAGNDYAGLEALRQSIPTYTYRSADRDFIELVRAADKATDRVVLGACALGSTREAYRIAGKRHSLHHDRWCEQMHGAKAVAELAASNLKFTAEHGHHAWWDEMGLELGDLELVMRYEIATIQLVALWEAYCDWCERVLHVDGRTAILGSLTSLNGRAVLKEIDAAIAERDCAEDARWLDALQQHEPLWVHSPDVLDDAQQVAREMFDVPLV